MSIFTNRDAKHFKEGLNGFEKLIKEEKLTKEELILKKTYVEICSLSTEKTNFKFSDLAIRLNLEENEVEEWAIEAISKKIIDAKID